MSPTVSPLIRSVLNRGLVEITRARMLGGLHGRHCGAVAGWRGSYTLLPVARTVRRSIGPTVRADPTLFPRQEVVGGHCGEISNGYRQLL